MSSGRQEDGKRVLFVCVENAGRSQMAEGFFKKYAPAGWSAASAGSSPVQETNPVAVQAMKEAGIDISMQRPKVLSDKILRSSDVKVSMGCIGREECPAVFLGDHRDWAIEDPKGRPIEDVRRIRDEIERRVRELVADIK